MESKEEILLKPNPHRWTYFPIEYEDIHKDFVKKHEDAIWHAQEIDLEGDKKDFKKLTVGDFRWIKQTLAFFAAFDGLIIENLAARFLPEVQISEVRAFYTVQIFMENIHNETYGEIIEVYVPDKMERDFLFKSIQTIPSIQKKADWGKRWLDSTTHSFAERLVAFAIVEGVLFSASFACIFYFKKRGLLAGLCEANELISRDEGLHCAFACHLYSKYISNKLSTEKMREIIEEAVRIEKEFVRDSIPDKLPGMNADLMCEYVEFVADRLLLMLDYSPIWNKKNPFEWMEMISVQGKTNFFEKHVTEYSKALSVSNTSHKCPFEAGSEIVHARLQKMHSIS